MARFMGRANLGTYQAAVDAALVEMTEDGIIERIWDGDYTVWKLEPDDIAIE